MKEAVKDNLFEGLKLGMSPKFTRVFCPYSFSGTKWEKISGTKGEKMELTQSRHWWVTSEKSHLIYASNFKVIFRKAICDGHSLSRH